MSPGVMEDNEGKGKKGLRRSKFGHLIHQYRRVAQTEITELFALLPAVHQRSADVFAPEITNA
eukprot:4236978-Amphidinium_carterae.1